MMLSINPHLSAYPLPKPRKARLLHISPTSGWAQKRFYPALLNELKDYFELTAIVDIIRPIVGLQTKLSLTQNGKILLNKLNDGELSYYPICSLGGNALPQKANFLIDAFVIHCLNGNHIYYIERALAAYKHVLCEKPLVPVMDSIGDPDRSDLERLIKLTDEGKKKELIMMDAEHYSAKKASKIFFDQIEMLVSKYGQITQVEGYLKEIDDPSHPRNKIILSLENRTGLIDDTGVHMLSIVSGIGGEVSKVKKVCCSTYPEYDVETYAEVELSLTPTKYFSPNATFNFTVAKFVDQLIIPQEQNKSMEFTFKKDNVDTKVKLDFDAGKVYKVGNDENGHDKITDEITSSKTYSDNEYVNILTDFYQAIYTGTEPFTNFSKSIVTLEALHKIRNFSHKEEISCYKE